MSRNRLRLALSALALPLCASATCRHVYVVPQAATRSIDYRVALPSVPQRLEVQFYDGLLTLEPAPTLECRVTVELVASDEAAVEALAAGTAPVVEAQGNGRTAKLQVAMPPGTGMDAVRTTWRLRAPDSLTVAVRTRKGGVVARGAGCDLEVDGGSGVIDARMAGGTAVLATTSGSLMLRGDYPLAEVRSGIGRIDVQAPARAAMPIDLRVASDRGDVYLDLRRGQSFDLEFHGELHRVECDPEVRLDWQQVSTQNGVEVMLGRLGDPQPALVAGGKLHVDTNGPVRVRVQPDAGPLRGTR